MCRPPAGPRAGTARAARATRSEAAMSQVAIARGQENGVAVIDVDGDLDVGAVDDVDAALEAALAAGAPLVVDLVDVNFIDSTGMRAMIGARRRSRELGVPMVCVCPDNAAVWR